MANGIAYVAYKNLISGKTEVDKVAYNKGVIAGMKMLFLNMEEDLDHCKEFIKSFKEVEETENETV